MSVNNLQFTFTGVVAPRNLSARLYAPIFGRIAPAAPAAQPPQQTPPPAQPPNTYKVPKQNTTLKVKQD